MRIVSFSVSRFRSIIDAEKIALGDLTTLLGRNNEGKSNILKALSYAIQSIRIHSTSPGLRIRNPSLRGGRRNLTGFEWNVDFPVQLINETRGNKKTRFRVDFELDEEDNRDFLEAIGSNINGQLPVEILIGSDGYAEIILLKQGKAFKTYQEKSQQICDFIAQRLDFIYIPAVRTEADAIEVVRSRFRRLLSTLEDNPEYKAAIGAIQALQAPLLRQLANDVQTQLQRFIPSIRGVEIDTSEQRLLNSVSSQVDVIINDGVPTSLEYKGDGIKSLVALSLFQSSSTSRKSRVIAIEEPESHLHPGAVHELRRVLTDLSSDGQVILTTHSPAFVNRQRLSDVVLVEGGKAARVKGIDEIRKSLGIMVSDNLMNAEFSIVCEGPSDAKALKYILSAMSHKIRSAVTTGGLVFDPLTGSGKLAYKLASLNRDVFNSFAILDFDDAGRTAVEDAVKKGVLETADYALLRVRGTMDSELEDLVKLDTLKAPFLAKYGLDIGTMAFKGKLKFSDRMKAGFEAAGRLWTDALEIEIKELVSSELQSEPLDHLSENAVDLLSKMIVSIEHKLRGV